MHGLVLSWSVHLNPTCTLIASPRVLLERTPPRPQRRLLRPAGEGEHEVIHHIPHTDRAFLRLRACSHPGQLGSVDGTRVRVRVRVRAGARARVRVRVGR